MDKIICPWCHLEVVPYITQVNGPYSELITSNCCPECGALLDYAGSGVIAWRSGESGKHWQNDIDKYRVEHEAFFQMTEIKQPRELYFAGIRIQQTWTTLFLLEKILNEEKDITRIVELGTGCGALALFFGLHMMNRGIVLTLDTEEHISAKWRGLTSNLPVEYCPVDVMSEFALQLVKTNTVHDRTLVFCDAGEKNIRSPQFHSYAAILKPRDIIMIHDYGNSITEKDVMDIPNLAPYRQDDFDSFRCYILSRICRE